MTIYAVDKDYYVLKEYEEKHKRIESKDKIRLFTNSISVWDACQKEVPDVVFVENECSGSEILIKNLKTNFQNTAIVLTCGEKNISPDVVNQGLFAVLKKPIKDEDIKTVVFNLKHPILSKFNKI